MRNLVMNLVCVVVLALGGALWLGREATAADQREAPTLEWLKSMLGEWVQVDKGGKATDVVMSKMRLTAGGSAILEILFPGTDQEMVSLYYQDGDKLMMTHYCMLGNQPSMQARYGVDRNQLVFEFVSGTNMEPTDSHMHRGTFTRADKNHLRTDWENFTDGKHNATHGFELMRRPQ
jgi:hypothetical protein